MFQARNEESWRNDKSSLVISYFIFLFIGLQEEFEINIQLTILLCVAILDCSFIWDMKVLQDVQEGAIEESL